MDKTSLATGLAFVTSPLMTQINSDSTDPTHQEASLLSVWSVVISVISGKVSIQIALTGGTQPWIFTTTSGTPPWPAAGWEHQDRHLSRAPKSLGARLEHDGAASPHRA